MTPYINQIDSNVSFGDTNMTPYDFENITNFRMKGDSWRKIASYYNVTHPAALRWYNRESMKRTERAESRLRLNDNIYQYRVLPCPNFSKEDLNLIQRHGFLTFPQFIDNGFKTKGGLRWRKALNNAKHYHPLFFLANDNAPLMDIKELNKYCAHIIFPLHKKSELDIYWNNFNWIGFPNNPKLRDYDIEWFVKNTPGKLRWWLGLHDYPEEDPGVIKEFHGIDSTLPELYAGKYGKLWKDWRDYNKPPNKLHWRVILEINVQNFRLFLDKFQPNGKDLEEYLAPNDAQVNKMKDEREAIVICPECGEEICIQVAIKDDLIFVRTDIK